MDPTKKLEELGSDAAIDAIGSPPSLSNAGNEDVADELESGGSLVAVSSLSLTSSALNPGRGEGTHKHRDNRWIRLDSTDSCLRKEG